MMGIDAQIAAISTPFFALVTVLLAVAMAHPEPQIRARAERLLAVIFRAR
ncbi:hypothetical protein [Streptomyces sp. XD-27]|nr:hypothetical protein [Streptomyces sp. XD-27]WKX70037.1 hypothetical protein Q3Y56_09050 [Streptomyces sp. XD-27]